ncbi:MAG: hypothetical protein CVT77_12215 [Alphaproteobacteria bacterium HGW-Alphaproteobacteria-16]|nr:MAG: hypothetical protein CVT77_12215 [Alphaproteobacteria bacterium HGW-Alphaproteobacteria-16]
MDAALITSLVQAGPTGIALFIAWQLLQQLRSDRSELTALLKDKALSEAKLAAALTLLALKITGRPHDGDPG